jgi:hypothetical protein
MRGAEERQIYVTERKLEVLKCMDLDYIGIFTCDPKKSNVHVKGYAPSSTVVPTPVWPVRTLCSYSLPREVHVAHCTQRAATMHTG